MRMQISGLSAFNADDLVAGLPNDGASIRLAIKGVVYLEGELVQPVDVDRSDGAPQTGQVLSRPGWWSRWWWWWCVCVCVCVGGGSL